jgi:hypothetical protein
MPEDIKTLERGSIYFFYQPKVEKTSPGGEENIQRLYMILSPDGRDRYRLAIIGRKKLPEPGKSGRERFWGFIETVRKDPASIAEKLEPEKYETKTRGERFLPAARPAAEGVYRILLHGDHTHLVFATEFPEEHGEVQEELNISPEASYIISVKNPDKPSPPGAGLPEHMEAEFSEKMKDVFRGRRFANADPPEMLDKEGVEFVLISASEDIQDELGIKLKTEDHPDIFSDLRIDKSKFKTEPIFSGEWK